MLFSGDRVFFRAFDCGKQGGRGYVATHAWIPPELRGGDLSVQRRELALFVNGLCSATLSPVCS